MSTFFKPLLRGVAAVALVGAFGASAHAETVITHTVPMQTRQGDSSLQSGSAQIINRSGMSQSARRAPEANVRYDSERRWENRNDGEGKRWEGKGKVWDNHSPAERVEARITHLHEKLQITPAQENQWGSVAQTMRDNEAAVRSAIEDRHAHAAERNAIEDLQSYQHVQETQADGVRKLVAAFQPLYDAMPDAQKKNADDVFGNFEGHRPMPGKHGGHHHGKMHKGKHTGQ